MSTVVCPECETTQEVTIHRDTYVVVCEHCRAEFKLPRAQRVNKREPREFTSSVNIRIGCRADGDTLHVGWTVQSAEKHNRFLERRSVSVDVSAHPQKTHWYVAIFKALQHVGEYKSARIWVKHDQVIDHLAGELTTPEDDPRTPLVEAIRDLSGEKFYGCEFRTADHVGRDIAAMLR